MATASVMITNSGEGGAMEVDDGGNEMILNEGEHRNYSGGPFSFFALISHCSCRRGSCARPFAGIHKSSKDTTTPFPGFLGADVPIEWCF